MVSLERCMGSLRFQQIEADRARLGALDSAAVADRLLGVLMLQKRHSRTVEDPGKYGPAVGRAHVDHPYRRNARARWLDEEQARYLATLDAAPELAFRRAQE